MFWSPDPIFLVPPGGSKLIGAVVLVHCEGQLLCGLGPFVLVLSGYGLSGLLPQLLTPFIWPPKHTSAPERGNMYILLGGGGKMLNCSMKAYFYVIDNLIFYNDFSDRKSVV